MMTTAWLFDVDGVITNPTEKKVTETKPVITKHRFDKGTLEYLNQPNEKSLI